MNKKTKKRKSVKGGQLTKSEMETYKSIIIKTLN